MTRVRSFAACKVVPGFRSLTTPAAALYNGLMSISDFLSHHSSRVACGTPGPTQRDGLMPRRESKVGMSSVLNPDPIEICEKDWRRIEAKCGHHLDKNIREQIQQATQAFYLEAFSELKAARTVDARRAIKKIMSIAEALREEVKPPADLDARFYAIHLLRNHLRDDRLNPTSIPYRDPLATFSNLISSFEIACELSLHELSDPNRAEFQEGKAWNSWVCRLVKVLEPSGLPTYARKDSDKRKHERPSAFVILISALQEYVPTQCRRVCSESGVATAISRAKRKLSGQ